MRERVSKDRLVILELEDSFQSLFQFHAPLLVCFFGNFAGFVLVIQCNHGIHNIVTVFTKGVFFDRLAGSLLFLPSKPGTIT